MSSCISSKSLVFLFVLYFSFNGLSPLCCFFLATRPICTREKVHKRCITELQISFGSIGYLRNLIILNCVLVKSIAYFYFFTPRFLWLQMMSSMYFLLNVAIGNLPAYIYSLTLFAFLGHQTSRFYHISEANLVPLLIFIARIDGYTLLVSLPCFSAKY